MPTDRELYRKLGKLLEAAKANDGYDEIWDKFWQIVRQMETSPGDYCDPDTSSEEDMRAVYNAYTDRLWLIDATDAANKTTRSDASLPD